MQLIKVKYIFFVKFLIVARTVLLRGYVAYFNCVRCETLEGRERNLSLISCINGWLESASILWEVEEWGNMQEK